MDRLKSDHDINHLIIIKKPSNKPTQRVTKK